jgi:hypothetical protein
MASREGHFAGHRIHHLVVVLLQIDDAVAAETADQFAGHRIQRDELVAGRDVEHPAIALAVGPVGEAAAGEFARRRFAARPLVFLVHPQHLAGRGIEPDHRAARAGGDVDHPVGHQRRGFPVVFGTRAERVGLETPRDLELAEIVLVDLVERRIVRVREVGSVGSPFPIGRGGLTGELDRHVSQDCRDREACGEQAEPLRRCFPEPQAFHELSPSL